MQQEQSKELMENILTEEELEKRGIETEQDQEEEERRSLCIDLYFTCQ